MRERLDGLYDEPRPGAPRQIRDADIERLIVRRLTPTGLSWKTVMQVNLRPPSISEMGRCRLRARIPVGNGE